MGVRAALAVFRLVARILLPRHLLEEHGPELEDTLARRLTAAARGPLGPWPRLVLEMLDVARTRWREARTTGLDGPAGPRRERSGGGFEVNGVWWDVRTSFRSLARRPGLALGIALTMGLGIGATTTIYGVVDGVILRPLPFADPDRLVAFGAPAEPTAAGASAASTPDRVVPLVRMSSTEYKLYAERVRSLSELAAISPDGVLLSDEAGTDEEVSAARVSPDFFDMLGAAPALGRTFRPEEYTVPPAPVAMISYELWQGHFGGDPDILGRQLETPPSSEIPRPIVVGILPRGFRPPEAFFPAGEAPQIYGPLPISDPEPGVRTMWPVYGLGRLDRAATLDGARAEATELASDIALALPGGPHGDAGIALNDLHDQTVGEAAGGLWVFLGAAALLLALAALNAATLFLARALDRRHELGVRRALGAGRGRVARLLLSEAGILSAGGGLLGLGLAYLGVATFLRLAPPTIPRLDEVTVDGRVLAIALLGTVGAALVAGLLPALRVVGGSAWDQLQSGGRTVAEPSSRLRVGLVGAQLALAVVLACGAGLLFSSFMKVRSADLGFDPQGLLEATPARRGPTERLTPATARNAWREWDPVLAAIAHVRGVASVGGASDLPLRTPSWSPRLLMPGDDESVVREGIAGYAISGDYLRTLGTAVLQGRGLDADDGPDAERVALVNEAFARTQLDGRDPLGVLVRRKVDSEFADAGWIDMRIVGVVEDIVQARSEDGPRPAIYIPYGQAEINQLLRFRTVVRTSEPLASVLPELRRSLAAGGWTLIGAESMERMLVESRASPRFRTGLVAGFALVALLLAAIGLHGSLAHNVRRRRRELGVRMALGADRWSVLRMVLGQGMRLAGVGLGIGLLVTLASSRVLAAFLYGMRPNDPVTLGAVVVILLIVSVVACLMPARRATAVDPVEVLSSE